MIKRENNDWLIINQIIYKIYTTEDCKEMRKNFLLQLKMLIDFDSADFYLGGDDENIYSPVTYNLENPTSDKYDSIDYSRGILYGGRSIIYRETDIISDEKRCQTEYYKKVYKPNNWHYSINMILVYEKKLVGVVTLYRTITKEDFKYDDVFVLDFFKDHLSYRLYSETKNIYCSSNKISIKKAVEVYGFTKREEQVIHGILEGKSNDNIAECYSISINTLKKHLMNIYHKMNINRKDKILMMIQND